MSNPYTITSLNEMNESMIEAMAEINLLLSAANGGPLPKKTLKASMSGDTIAEFENALKYLALDKKIYFTTKGYVNLDYDLSDEERIAHIKWCLKLIEFSSNQYLMDKNILLEVPQMLRRLQDKHGRNFPQWKNSVLNVHKQAQMMGRTLGELSDAYDQISEAAQKMLPKEKPTKLKSLKDLGDLKAEMKKIIRCPKCEGENLRVIGKNKDGHYCKDCQYAW
mgnify:CR=1 FL=1|jgi:hypothetical protein|tara:strand:+ start:262 stop:927 length:666 start_codon:yes stop_codon:yes gene_type:complete